MVHLALPGLSRHALQDNMTETAAAVERFRAATLTLGTFRLWLAEGDRWEITCTEGARRVCGVGPSNASGSDLSSATRAEPLALPDFRQSCSRYRIAPRRLSRA